MREPLKLHKPVTPFEITQRFGEDNVCIDTATRSKCFSRLANAACPVGYESLYTSAGLKGHNGIDLKAAHKQEVYAATDGKVYKIQSERERGIGVEVISRKRFDLSATDHTYRVKTRYWHLDSFVVKRGQRVKAGDLIGYADSTGLSTGTHLHFEVKPVKKVILKGFRNVLQDNGYFGAIDPEPYFKD